MRSVEVLTVEKSHNFEISANCIFEKFNSNIFQGGVMIVLMRAEDFNSVVATSPLAFIENLQGRK